MKWQRVMKQSAPYSCRNKAEKLVGSAREFVIPLSKSVIVTGRRLPSNKL